MKSFRDAPPLSRVSYWLKMFILRGNVLKLYRDFQRTLRMVENKNQRKELNDWIRSDFKANKHHTDEDIIKNHISRGKLALREIETTIRLSGSSK